MSHIHYGWLSSHQSWHLLLHKSIKVKRRGREQGTEAEVTAAASWELNPASCPAAFPCNLSSASFVSQLPASLLPPWGCFWLQTVLVKGNRVQQSVQGEEISKMHCLRILAVEGTGKVWISGPLLVTLKFTVYLWWHLQGEYFTFRRQKLLQMDLAVNSAFWHCGYKVSTESCTSWSAFFPELQGH